MAFFTFPAQAGFPPGSNMATPVVRNTNLALAFDAATDETIYFRTVMPSDYAAETITVTVHWRADSATSGAVKWNVAWEAMTGDIDSDSFDTDQTGTTTTAGTAGNPNTTAITFTQAQADGITAEDEFRLRVTRDADDAGDTMTGDAHVTSVTVAY